MDLPQFEAHADVEDRHWWFLGRRRILRTLLAALLPPSRETLVLDVGCGTGGLTAFFGKDYRCTGIDPSTNAITFAKKKFPQSDFVLGNAPGDVREMYAKADAVLLIDVLEHIPDDQAFVQKLIEGLKPGALLFMMAPADPSLWSPHDAGFGHERRYEEHTFRSLWAGQPVQELLVSHVNARLHPLVKLARKLSALRGKSWGPGDTDLGVPMAPVNSALQTIFDGEANRLLGVLKGTAKPYRRGVSLLTVLKRL